MKAGMKSFRKMISSELPAISIWTLVSYMTPSLKLKNATFGPDGFNYNFSEGLLAELTLQSVSSLYCGDQLRALN